MNANEKYKNGNAELLAMFKNATFDRQRAERILEDITNLNEPILDPDVSSLSTTYLFLAQSENNVEAVRFLLENGADPNFYVPDLYFHGDALSDLHFVWDDMDKEKRLEITKLFFEFGANPNKSYDGEPLYDHILWEVFNDSITPHEWDYIRRFFIILVAYGGGGEGSYSAKPCLGEPIDRRRIDEYDFRLFPCEDGYHLEGHLFNPEGIDIGKV